MWTPQSVGQYKLIATFVGSNSYNASYSETAVGVVAAPSPSVAPTATPIVTATPTPSIAPTPLGTSANTDIYIIIAVAAVVIVVIAAAVVFLRKRK
jgi:hypothetical protein